MSNVTSLFADLFEGRHDAYGTEEGGCTRIPPACVGHVQTIERHLSGTFPIGVYPMVCFDDDLRHGIDIIDPEWRVKWGCVDFDVKTKGKPSWDYETERDAHIAAVNLQKVLAALGVTSWIERTRSHGRHLWVFASTWTAAAVMRRSLIVATSVAGVSSREVNPKQESLAADQLGNYVRLPYPGGSFDTRIMVRAWTDEPQGLRAYLPPSVFVKEATAARTPVATLEAIANKYVAPEPIREATIVPYDGPEHGPLRRLRPLGKAIYKNGPHDGDRSNGLYLLAKCCMESGLTTGEALSLVDQAAERWGKFEGRRDRQEQLQRIVGRAYA